ncbi:hypothetical protein RJT34_11779 [Clitoria ternatea]|uniref:Uncharacterized protein n=1 Tax=Clitoria ternatea TaxID=43366 RepID=A0AAN9JMG5_CLITE
MVIGKRGRKGKDGGLEERVGVRMREGKKKCDGEVKKKIKVMMVEKKGVYGSVMMKKRMITSLTMEMDDGGARVDGEKKQGGGALHAWGKR